MLRKARLKQLPQLAGTATEGNHLACQPDTAPRYQQPITAEQNPADIEARGACDAQPTSQEHFWCPDANYPNHLSLVASKVGSDGTIYGDTARTATQNMQMPFWSKPELHHKPCYAGVLM